MKIDPKNDQADLFDLQGISYAYMTEQPVLDSLDLKIHSKTALAILGANGSGKSTLLKLLAGLIYPTGGHFYAFGHEVNEKAFLSLDFLRFFRKQVGFVFQNSDAQLFSASVWDEIAFAPLQSGLGGEETKNRVQDTARFLEIEDLLDRPPYQLSGGEKKKVALASVLSMNPSVLFLDEPTNGLDPRTQFWLVDFLKSLAGTGKTIITATHDLSIVEEIAQRVIILDETHKLAADGPVQEILSDRDLLLKVNLIHEHSHFHLGGTHPH